MYKKYPKTYHLPYSEYKSNSDKILQNDFIFNNIHVVVSIKYDGENTNFYSNNYHARSLNLKMHPSRSWVKKFHESIKNNIPDNYRICGENVFAKHTVPYENLDSYFYGFSVWENDLCLDWNSTLQFFNNIGITPVETIYNGIYNKQKILNEWDKIKNNNEGFVIRNSNSFLYDDFNKNVAKFVSSKFGSLIIDQEHWKTKPVIQNKLKG